MPNEVDDDVPVYFSPGDENIDLEKEVDKKALLEDEPPIEWSRYQPEKTLEQAAEEAKKKGEVKIKGKRNRDQDAKLTAELKKHPGKDGKNGASERSAENSIEVAQSNSFIQSATGKLKAMRHKLGIANKQEVSLSQFEGKSKEESGAYSSQTTQDGQRRLSWNRVLMVLTALNLFAVGIWCGSFLFPSTRMTTSMDETGTKSKSAESLRGDTTFSKVVERVSPVVVNVDTSYKRQSSNPKVKFDYSGANQDQASGVIIGSEGHILTNNHVIPQNTHIRITLNDGREFEGKVIGRDAYTDLAVIKIEAKNLPVARFGHIHKMHSGDWAIVIGSPYGLDHSVSLGVISALDRKVADFNHHVPFIQTDAAINPGNSGGPLVNIDGEVIGIATGAVRSGARGIAFAIPIDVAGRVAKKLIRDGAIARPYIGIYMRDIDPQRKKARSLPGNPIAVAVANVVASGPADICGVKRGDIILKVNGTVVNSSDEVRAFIKTSNPGDILDMTMQRGLKQVDVKVRLGVYPKDI